MAFDGSEELQAELIKDFILESLEGLESFDREMLEIERGESGSETMHRVFRVMHSIKGTAGCLGLSKIERASHQGEDIMSLLRDGKIASSEDLVSTLLSLSDAVRGMLEELERTGGEGSIDLSNLFTKLKMLGSAEDPVEAVDSPPPIEAHPIEAAPAAFGLFEDDDAGSDDESAAAFGLFDCEDEPPARLPEPEPEVETASAPSKGGESRGNRTSIADSSIRVDVSHLDKVMNIVGELVLARNQIMLSTTNFDQAALITASQRLNIITTELQESVMKTRMQPIRNIWSRFPRVVRDLANELGKRVTLVMDGQDTELDRTLLEAIKDPLTHIVRNAIDHGIEAIEERVRKEKPEEGLLSMRAYHEGGQVIIEIMDDGAGINVDAVKAKAVSKNVITEAQAERMSDREAVNLIFSPGFSTAEKISNVSGRGVGMDVVKTNIERIGGSVDLQTERGQGSIINIKIPLTLAIIPALVVTSGGERFAIPQVSLLELVRIDTETGVQIEMLYGAAVYRLRGRLLPIVYLNEQLKLESAVSRDFESISNIVVLQADDRQFGLVVDEINDTEEIVVKPLGKQLKNLSCFAGATIMGDGKVALILDVLGLAQYSHVVSESKSRRIVQEDRLIRDEDVNTETLLLFEVGGRRMAIPLEQAARLEEFDAAKVERAGSQMAIQYRNQILPLVDVASCLGERVGDLATDDAGSLQVIVYSEKGACVGLVVSRVNDIVEATLELRKNSSEFGILGSVIIQGKVTDLLDASSVSRNSIPCSGEPLALA